MLYPDDCILLANTRNDMKTKMRILKEEYMKKGLKLNENNSEILIFGDMEDESFEVIKVVKNVKYLAVDINEGNKMFDNYIKTEVENAKNYVT